MMPYEVASKNTFTYKSSVNKSTIPRSVNISLWWNYGSLLREWDRTVMLHS